MGKSTLRNDQFLLLIAVDYGYGGGYSTTSYGAQGAAAGGGFMTGGSQASPSINRVLNPNTERIS